ncbi:MAG: LytTR family DNA-binding domain-containing protein [Gammaproteobacteria bacterium]
MHKLKHFLNKPFPQEESLFATFKIAAAISLFVVLFLYTFKPFGLHSIESGYGKLCVGFGVMSFTASMIYEWLVVRVLKFKGEGTHFTFGRWIVYFVGAMLLISVANFLYVRLAVMGSIDWSLFPYMLRGTLAIGFFPIVVIGAWALLVQEKKYQGIAHEFNQQSGLEEPGAEPFSAAGEAELFGVPVNDIRYIEAMQNYIKIMRVDPAGQTSKQVERATLKSLLNQDLGQSITRCHRSFLVNRDAIVSSTGNAQGLQLTVRDCESTVPVSRSYVAAFRHI